MWTEIKTFIQNIEFETWLSIISCLTGIVALFVGGTAYHNCKTIKKSLNDEKVFGDNSVDNSQKAGGDIVTYNYGCDTNALAALTSENFKACLNQAYDMFDKKTESNLKRIIEEASRIVKENQINLGSYTKLDWINVYFENAKTASDEYMQNVWAKVLALELEKPDSFSYKALDILKNMTADDFKLFEKMCSLSIDSHILVEEIYTEFGLSWSDRLKLCDYGLLNLNRSKKIYYLSPKLKLTYADKYYIVCEDLTNGNQELSYSAYTFTSCGVELESIINLQPNYKFMQRFVKYLDQKKPKQSNISLFNILSVENGKVEYLDIDIFKIMKETEQ